MGAGTILPHPSSSDRFQERRLAWLGGSYEMADLILPTGPVRKGPGQAPSYLRGQLPPYKAGSCIPITSSPNGLSSQHPTAGKGGCSPASLRIHLVLSLPSRGALQVLIRSCFLSPQITEPHLRTNQNPGGDTWACAFLQNLPKSLRFGF